VKKPSKKTVNLSNSLAGFKVANAFDGLENSEDDENEDDEEVLSRKIGREIKLLQSACEGLTVEFAKGSGTLSFRFS
jgi:hypothetical protein